MQVGALLLRHRLIGGVPDQQVAETERVLARELGTIGPDELLAREREEAGAHVRPDGLRAEGGDGAGVEDLALDGAALDHGTLVGVQSVQARGEQEVDRRWDRHVREVLDGAPRTPFEAKEAVVDQHREHLLDEQRVALRGFEDPVPRDLRYRRLPQEVVDEQRGLVTGEGLEKDRGGVHLAATPAGADVEQLGTSDTDQQDGGVARPVGEMLDQVQHRGLGPVDVVEDDDDRAVRARDARGPSGRPRRSPPSRPEDSTRTGLPRATRSAPRRRCRRAMRRASLARRPAARLRGCPPPDGSPRRAGRT